MTYQFDPKPEGLHYEPFTVPFCTKTMWWLHDGAPEVWIDLRSVFEALGMSWVRKWGMYCLAKRREWRLEACCDKHMRETLLVPGNKLPAVLGEVYGLLAGHHAAARRTRLLHLIWREKYAEIRDGGAVRIASAPMKTSRATKKRKVDAYVVRQIFVLRQKQYSQPMIAKALHVSTGVVQQVSAGTYKLSDEAQAVWWETFGAPKAAGAEFEGSKTVSRDAG